MTAKLWDVEVLTHLNRTFTVRADNADEAMEIARQSARRKMVNLGLQADIALIDPQGAVEW